MDISFLQQLYRGFWIDAPVGNNAFSFDQRQCQRIYVPPLINGNLDDLAVGTEPAFVEMAEGEERVCSGLKNFIATDTGGKPAFIFDNHNHAFFFWLAALEQGVVKKGAVLVHVDQHRDTREPGSVLALKSALGTRSWSLDGSSAKCQVPSASGDIRDAFFYTNHILNVGNFIPPALKLGIFSEVIHVASREAFPTDLPDNCVLDIDLDIFAPVMGYIPESLKIEKLRAWSGQAALVTMATSPFFMDQTLAITYAKIILSRS